MTVINRKVTFLCSCNEVFQEVYRERVVGWQVKMALDRQKVVTLSFRPKFGPERGSRDSHLLLLVGFHVYILFIEKHYLIGKIIMIKFKSLKAR